MTAGLRCREVSVRLGRAEVVRGVDLDVAAGSWLGLIGPNGAGKTTLLRAVAGLVDHTGDVSVDDAAADPTTVALVPQQPTIPPDMTVAEYVLLGRTAHLGWLARESASDHAVVVSVLRRLDLASFADRPLAGLSGGETQRVVIARALTQEAPVLLLDEPTSALDLGHQSTVLALVDELRRERRLTVVAVMHDLTTAARFADRLVLLVDGAVAAEGPPAEVLDDELLSQAYRTPLVVREVDGRTVVLPAT